MTDKALSTLRKISADWDSKKHPQSPLAFKRPVRPIAGGTAWEDAETGRDLIPGYDGRSDFERITQEPVAPALNPKLRPIPFKLGRYEYKSSGRDYVPPYERQLDSTKLIKTARPTLNPRLTDPTPGTYYSAPPARPAFDGPIQRKNIYWDKLLAK